MAYPNQTLDDKTLRRPNAFNVYFTDVAPWGIIMDGGLDVLATFTRASVGTTEIQQNVFTTAAINEARYKWVGGRRGLLIEPAATNLLFPSAVAATMSLAVTAQSYTLSFFGAGTVTLSIAASGVVIGTGTTLKTFTFTPSVGTLTLTVSGAVTEWQLETGAVATSRIITTSGAVTRAVDVPTIAASAFGFDASAGTFVCEFAPSLTGSAHIAYRLASSIAVYSQGASAILDKFQVGSLINSPLAFTLIAKNAASYSESGVSMSTNGAAAQSNAADIGTPGAYLQIGSEIGGSLSLNGVIFNLTYYPRKFTALELQAAST